MMMLCCRRFDKLGSSKTTSLPYAGFTCHSIILLETPSDLRRDTTRLATAKEPGEQLLEMFQLLEKDV
ncbi:hypothetical protein V1477_014471 [Vespula maculifrons]|uniref:Uncharacterized protein n=1 Tax=Vespula maculifrons TaxID=7453 RepID=A0ABD2BHK3_VESMC